MKLAALLAIALNAHGAISVVAHNCYALGANGGTTTALNITGATNLAVGVSAFSGGSFPPTVTDSTSNTFTARTVKTAGSAWIQTYDVDSPTTSSSYTVTVASISSFSSVCIVAWSGGKASSSFDQQDGNTATSATSVQAASGFTPGHANEIIVTFLSFAATNTPTINSSFGTADTANYSAGVNLGISSSWQIQTTATFRQPTWSWSSSSDGAMTMDAYQEPSSGPPINQFPRMQ